MDKANQHSGLQVAAPRPQVSPLSERVEKVNAQLSDHIARLGMMLDRVRGSVPEAVAGNLNNPARAMSVLDHVEAQSAMLNEMTERFSQLEQYI